MSYHETIRYLYDLQLHGIKFGLDNIHKLASELGSPHKSFLTVHVAGTNGKGSTSAIIASILQQAGLGTGLFTSPHLVSFTERIRLNGEEISEKEVIELVREIRDAACHIRDFSPTFFEAVTAMAFLHFARKKVDIAVIETGMGGRLDATNIVTPQVSVITNIGFDHREFLGNTLREIAREKAGIIKKGIPVVSSFQEPEAAKIIEEQAGKNNSELFFYGSDFSAALKREDISEICFDYEDRGSIAVHDLLLKMAGEHQMQNASVAIKAALLLNSRGLIPKVSGDVNVRHSSLITPDCIREGVRNFRWPGRLECLNEEPAVFIDGAHNPAAADALAKTLKKCYIEKFKKIIIILGVMDDKDIKGLMKPLLPFASELICTSAACGRAAAPEKIAGIATAAGYPNAIIAATVKDAVDMAMKSVSGGVLNDSTKYSGGGDFRPLILVTGSFYAIGEAKELFGHKGVLSRMREWR
jgi:dihydrofolate synthase / folylpolyglutamate synthase